MSILRTLARDRRTLGRMALQVGLSRASSEFMLDFWQSPPAFSSIPSRILAVDCAMEWLSKRAQKNNEDCQNEAQDAPGTLPGRLKMAPGDTSTLKFMRFVF